MPHLEQQNQDSNGVKTTNTMVPCWHRRGATRCARPPRRCVAIVPLQEICVPVSSHLSGMHDEVSAQPVYSQQPNAVQKSLAIHSHTTAIMWLTSAALFSPPQKPSPDAQRHFCLGFSNAVKNAVSFSASSTRPMTETPYAPSSLP